MKLSVAIIRSAAALVTMIGGACLLEAQPRPTVQFPDAPGKEVAQKVCNTCHGPEVTVAKGRTRQQWGEVITSMVGRGAKATDQEFAQVLDYLAKNLPPETNTAATAGATTPALPRRPGAGPADVQIVDTAAADRGKRFYISECMECHGQKARGTEQGADLVRSLVVLHDRYGSTIGPFLKKGHKMQSGRLSANLTEAQVADLAHFLHRSVADTLRSGPYSKVIDVLTGDPKAGAAYFNGAGKCSTCHSVTGDMAGIGAKYDPPTLQQRFVFPKAVGFGRGGGVTRSKPVTVTVTQASGKSVTGVLDRLDDFNVSLRDASGQYYSYEITPGLKVEKHDPYAAHYELLDQYTDKNIHDVVAYLVSLK